MCILLREVVQNLDEDNFSGVVKVEPIMQEVEWGRNGEVEKVGVDKP